MFTWICPQCGREVPPAYTECPDCAAKASAAGAPAPPPQQPVYQAPPTQAGMPAPQQPYPPYPPQPQYQQPPQYPPPAYPPQPQQPAYQQPTYQQPAYQQPGYPQPQYPQPPYQQPVYQQPQYQPQYQPPPPPLPVPVPPPPPVVTPDNEPRIHVAPAQSSLFATPEPPPQGAGGMPTWVLTILCIAGFGALFAGAYWLLGGSHSASPSTSVESPAAKPGAATNPWQKFIEISGLRFVADPQHKGKVLAKFMVTNHSSGGLSGLAGNVTIWASTKKSDEDAQGTFSFITNLDAYESKEVTSPLTTKFKLYELPDWQNMTTDLQITAPGS